MKKFGKKNIEETVLSFSIDEARKRTQESLIQPGFTTQKVNPFHLAAVVQKQSTIQKHFAEFMSEQSLEQLKSLSQLKNAFEKHFNDIDSMYKVSSTTFEDLVATSYPELFRVLAKNEEQTTQNNEKKMNSRTKAIRSVFDEWFNEHNISVFLDQKNMSVSEIHNAFESSYNTEDAPWKVIKMSRGFFAKNFREYLKDKYNRSISE